MLRAVPPDPASLTRGPTRPPARAGGLAALHVLLDRSTTAERVADGLRDLIVRGELLSGEPLREATVASAFGISRNTAREAFRLLARERLTAHALHRGVVVKILAPEDVRDIFATRRALELPALAQRDAVPAATRDALAETVATGERGAADGDWGEVATADLCFHGHIVELLGSRRIDELFRVTLAELRLAFATADQAALLEPFVPRNRQIYEHVAAGELPTAALALEVYLTDSEHMLTAAVARAGEPA